MGLQQVWADGLCRGFAEHVEHATRPPPHAAHVHGKRVCKENDFICIVMRSEKMGIYIIGIYVYIYIYICVYIQFNSYVLYSFIHLLLQHSLACYVRLG